MGSDSQIQQNHGCQETVVVDTNFRIKVKAES